MGGWRGHGRGRGRVVGKLARADAGRPHKYKYSKVRVAVDGPRGGALPGYVAGARALRGAVG